MIAFAIVSPLYGSLIAYSLEGVEEEEPPEEGAEEAFPPDLDSDAFHGGLRAPVSSTGSSG